MYRMKLTICIGAVLLAAASGGVVCAHAQVSAEWPAGLDSIRALLPVGTITVDVMDLAPSPRLTELTERLQAAIRADPEWFQKAVRAAAPGEPLAYDRRMGLTEEEWQEYLRLATSLTMRKVAEAPLTVRAQGARLVLDGGAAFPDLSGIAIDLAADQVTTPAMTIRGSTETHTDGEGAALGPWDGRTWKEEVGNAENGDIEIVSLTLGRLRESGRGVIYWQHREARGGEPTQRVVRILYFDRPR